MLDAEVKEATCYADVGAVNEGVDGHADEDGSASGSDAASVALLDAARGDLATCDCGLYDGDLTADD